MAATAPAGSAGKPYELLGHLATGGMAEVHLARQTGLGGFERLVVVKRLLPGRALDPASVQALLDEARLAALLSHVNIVQVLDVGLHEGSVQIVMEYLHGHDAGEIFQAIGARGERLGLDAAIAIVLSACAGLHHAHEQVGPDGRPLEIVHRDVSPENVFVTYDGGVKLIDFGIAQGRLRLGKTADGLVKGKPGYMAPEQVQGRPLDRRTDVYAATVLLYELTTGQRCFAGESAYDLLTSVVERDPRPPSTLVSGYPPALEAIVLRGLARDRQLRYPTAQALQRDLEAFARERGLDVSQFALAALMERVFGAEIAAWRTAKQRGRSLGDHVAESGRVTRPHAPAAAPGSAPPGPAPTGDAPPRRPRRAFLAGALLLLLAGAAGVAAWAARESAPPAPPTIESAPAPPAPRPPAPPAPAATPDAAPARPLQGPAREMPPRKERAKDAHRPRRLPPDPDGPLPR